MSAVDRKMMEGANINSNNLAFQEKRKIEDMNNKLKLENRVKNAIFTRNNFEAPANQKLMAENAPKRPEGDSRFSNFVRGFRRENTDFFAHAKRHSAVFAEQQSSPAKNITPQKMQRSSAIFQRNRPKGEPILTDFVAKRDNSLGKKGNAPERPSEPVRMRQSNANNLDLRLRREKTESVIFVSRNPNAPQFNPLAQLQVKSRTQKGKTLLYASVWIHFYMLIVFIVFVSKACRSHNHVTSYHLVSSLLDMKIHLWKIFKLFSVWLYFVFCGRRFFNDRKKN